MKRAHEAALEDGPPPSRSRAVGGAQKAVTRGCEPCNAFDEWYAYPSSYTLSRCAVAKQRGGCNEEEDRKRLQGTKDKASTSTRTQRTTVPGGIATYPRTEL